MILTFFSGDFASSDDDFVGTSSRSRTRLDRRCPGDAGVRQDGAASGVRTSAGGSGGGRGFGADRLLNGEVTAGSAVSVAN